MQVDSFPMSFHTSFDDFFNLDLLSNSSSSQSPQPEQQFSLPSPLSSSSPSPFFSTLPDSTPFDFLAAFPDAAATLESIDPTLTTPATTAPLSDFGEPLSPTSIDDALLPLPVKVGGKGKARRGTVVSGGISKRAPPPAEKENTIERQPTTAAVRSPDCIDDDDWRPSPEEYKKMSSKEKRQLRNKISARNFRVRRKEYITTLEGDIAERDRILDAVRTELGSTRDENTALRQEIASLKKALLAGRGTPVLPPPAPLSPALSPVSSPALMPSPAPSQKKLVTPNTKKDLSASPRLRAFWGGAHTGLGFVPVHTTLIPPPPAVPVLPAKRGLQENLNPALNFSAPSVGTGAPWRKETFDKWTEANPFTLKTLDAYRMHLWGTVGQQNALQQQQSAYQQQLGNASKPLGALAQGVRPHYFKTPSSASTSYPTPPSSPSPPSSTVAGSLRAPTQKEAEVAALAGGTLMRRLGGAFWDAFSGAPTSPSLTSSAQPKSIDVDKVRRVLEGRAVVRVVDLEPSLRESKSPKLSAKVPGKDGAEKEKCSGQDLLEESFRGLSLAVKRA